MNIFTFLMNCCRLSYICNKVSKNVTRRFIYIFILFFFATKFFAVFYFLFPPFLSRLYVGRQNIYESIKIKGTLEIWPHEVGGSWTFSISLVFSFVNFEWQLQVLLRYAANNFIGKNVHEQLCDLSNTFQCQDHFEYFKKSPENATDCVYLFSNVQMITYSNNTLKLSFFFQAKVNQ